MQSNKYKIVYLYRLLFKHLRLIRQLVEYYTHYEGITIYYINMFNIVYS